jgi:hypothetical protein
MRLQVDIPVSDLDDAIDALEEIIAYLQSGDAYHKFDDGGRFELIQPAEATA